MNQTRQADDPKHTLCAWCRRNGQPVTAAKDPRTGTWYALAHEEALARWSAATHGICPACRPIVAREWGIVDHAA